MYTYSPHRRARNREEGTGERKRRNDRRFYLGWSSARAGQGELAVGALVHGRLGGRDTSSSERRQVCTRAAGYVDERVRWGKGAGVHRGSKGVGVAAISQGGHDVGHLPRCVRAGGEGIGYAGSRVTLNQPQPADGWGPRGGFAGDSCEGASGAWGPLVYDREQLAGGGAGQREGEGARRFGPWAESLVGQGLRAPFSFSFILNYVFFSFFFLLSLLDSYSNMPQIQRRSSQAYASHKGKIWGLASYNTS
jgi:hypothetical protein